MDTCIVFVLAPPELEPPRRETLSGRPPWLSFVTVTVIVAAYAGCILALAQTEGDQP